MKSIKKNYLYNVSNQMLTLITPLITTPYISRVLKADGIGEYSYAFSITSYFILFAGLGTATYGQREISYLQDKRRERSKIFWEVEFISLICSIISLTIYFVLGISLHFTALYHILAINILAVSFDISWLFQGVENFRIIVIRNIFFKLFSLIYIFIFVKTHDDLLVYTIGMSSLTLLANASLWFRIREMVDCPVWKEIKLKKHLSGTIALFLPNIAISLYTVLDKTMLGLFSNGMEENGYYEQALKLSKLTLTLVTSLVAVMIPRVGYYFEKKEMDKVRELVYSAYNFVLFLGMPLFFGLLGISNNLVPWFYGTGFEKVTIILPILGLLIIIIGLSNVTGLQYLLPTKRQELLTRSVFIGACSNIFLNLILIPNFFSLGAAIASVVSESIVTIVQFYYIHQDISIYKIVVFAKNYIIAGSIMFSVLRLEDYFLKPSLINTSLMVVSGAGIYFMILFMLHDTFLIDNLKK